MRFFSRDDFSIERKDDTSLSTVDACARLGGEPFFIKGKTDGSDPKAMALYLIGDDELWVNYNAVQERKAQIERGEDVEEPTKELLREVAFSAVSQVYVDRKTGKSVFLYVLKDGKTVKFDPEEVLAERKRILEERKSKTEQKKYDELEDVARRNDCIVLRGHKDCEYSVGVWAISAGKLVRYTVGAVKQKRIELGLETSQQEEQSE